MIMPGRKYKAGTSSYGFGFNGKANDNDVKGEGNQQDYGMRIYDTRLGRFLSVDPISNSFPWSSPYSFAEGDLIRSIDLDGLEKYIIFREVNDKGELMKISIHTFTDEDGNLRDNEMYKNNSKLKKFDVYVITRNVTTGAQVGSVKYQKALTKEQDKVYKQFSTKKPVSEVLKKRDTENDHFEFKTRREGKFLGNNYNDGYEQDASLSLTTEIKLLFKGNSDVPAPGESSKLTGVARTLRLFPNANATLTGNTGTEPGNPSNLPIGNSPQVIQSPSMLNGILKTTGELMKARADAAKKMLHDNFTIDNNRMDTQTGSQFDNPEGRKVDIKITGIKL